MSDATLHLRQRIEAAVDHGWTIREGAGGFIAELDNRHGVWRQTIDELLKVVDLRNGSDE